jgi:hypothetical protein
VQSHEYRDLVAAYIERHFGPHGLRVYTEVSLGKTIIGKNRRIDVFALRTSDQRALAVECKYQRSQGTADEKIPYALQDLEALWIPGCLVYGGDGWSEGVLHTLEGSKSAAFCLPEQPGLERTSQTLELDHIVAAVFGLWEHVISEAKLFRRKEQLTLPLKGPKKVELEPDVDGSTPKRRPSSG